MRRYLHCVKHITLQVDMSKVNLESMKGWIAKEINSILGFEDDVLIDMIYNLLSLDEVLQALRDSFLESGSQAHWSHTDSLLRAQRYRVYRKAVVLAALCPKRSFRNPSRVRGAANGRAQEAEGTCTHISWILGKGSWDKGEDRIFDHRNQRDSVFFHVSWLTVDLPRKMLKSPRLLRKSRV